MPKITSRTPDSLAPQSVPVAASNSAASTLETFETMASSQVGMPSPRQARATSPRLAAPTRRIGAKRDSTNLLRYASWRLGGIQQSILDALKVVEDKGKSQTLRWQSAKLLLDNFDQLHTDLESAKFSMRFSPPPC
jgi:hypothetical protein